MGGGPLSRDLNTPPLDPEPPRYLGAKPNLDHLRWAYRQINKLSLDVATGKKLAMPDGYNLGQAEKLLDSEAKNIHGVNAKHLRDARSDAQVLEEAARVYQETPDSIFEWTDKMIDEMERQMDRADLHCAERMGGTGTLSESNAKLEAIKKKCSEQLCRLRILRTRARTAFAPGTKKSDEPYFTAAHLLRFGVYVGRSPQGHGPGSVFRVAEHHADMAFRTYEAENRRCWWQGRWDEQEVEGIMLVIPPGHGKTAYGIHRQVLRSCQNPRRRVIVIHANIDEAAKNVQFVGAYFDSGEAPGRRVRSLFPELPALRQRNQSQIVFELPEVQRQPNYKAYGLHANAAGADCDELWQDDLIDQKIAEQEMERKRAFDRVNGTWERRKRGKRALTFITCTLWHHDDPNSRLIELTKNQKTRFRILIKRCGGPDSTPPFKPLWPEEYPAAKLKTIYGQMRNPRLYSACYECNPTPDGLRKVKRLAYYLPGDPTHQRFLARALFYLSLDPTATNRERSDRAGLVYVAMGDVITDGPGNTRVMDRRLRIIDARQFHATQTEGVNEVCAFALTNMVHYVIAETRSGFNATAEMLEARGMDVIRHDPKNRKKELRLGDVAPMLDDSLREKGFPGAVVEFPGRLSDDGKIVKDNESTLHWLEQQILEFGNVAEDHAVDALVQVCKEVGHELAVGEGSNVSGGAALAERTDVDARIVRDLAQYEQDQKRTAAEEDVAFWAGKGSSW